MASNRAWRNCLGNLAVTVSVALMASSALGQSYSDGPAGEPPSPAKIRPAPATASGLSDMLQVPPAPLTSAPRRAVLDREQTSAMSPVRSSLAERLWAWDDATRRNAQFQVELPAGASDATLERAHEIETLWNAGLCEWAIAQLRELESSGIPVALGVAWRTPRTAGTERGLTDVRIGTRTGGNLTGLDYDGVSGKLFAVVRWTTDHAWALYQSTTDGASWAETYFWDGDVDDVDLVVVSGYVYVGYVFSGATSQGRLRRIVAATGAVDTAYGYEVVLDAGANAITDVAVASNADSADNRVYYAVRQSDNAVRFAWDISTSGSTFTETSPAGTAATGGLDLCWNPGFASYYAWISYIGTDSRVHVVRRNTAGWDEVTTAPFDGTHLRSAISAWDDHVICAHELLMDHDQGIRYFITHDGGETWDYYNYIGEPGEGEGPYQMADVTARGGAGTAIVFTHETSEPDDVLVRYRRNYAPGLWHDEIRVNDNDVSTGTWTALSWTPRATASTGELSYGLIYFYGSTPYFDRFRRQPGDTNCDGLVSYADINPFVLALAGQAGYEARYPDCDWYSADCNNDGSVTYADINPFVKLLNSGE